MVINWIFFLAFLSAEGLINQIEITTDDRPVIFINRFGFGHNGVMQLEIQKFEIQLDKDPEHNPDHEKRAKDEMKPVGFLISISEKDASSFPLHVKGKNNECILTSGGLPSSILTYIIDRSNSTLNVTTSNPGFYHLFFVNCEKESKVSLSVVLSQYHEDDGNQKYLPVGDWGLPIIYFVIFFCYIAAIIFWISLGVRRDIKSVNIVHTLMSVLIFLKTLSVFSRAVEYHFLQIYGTAHGWNIPYYLFTVCKGIMTFVVIGLIGAGYSFFKFYLTDKDRKIFAVLISLQLLANFAQIEVWEGDLGSRPALIWAGLLQGIDIICCIALLIHIGMTSQHLEQAAQTDGKAARIIMKLKLFRQFYQLIIAYLYLTRIFVIFLDLALPYGLEWFSYFFSEFITLVFYVVVGYKFRPQEDSPYFKVHEEDLTDVDELSVELVPFPEGTHPVDLDQYEINGDPDLDITGTTERRERTIEVSD